MSSVQLLEGGLISARRVLMEFGAVRPCSLVQLRGMRSPKTRVENILSGRPS